MTGAPESFIVANRRLLTVNEPATSEALIRIAGVSKTWTGRDGAPVTALTSAELSIRAGEFVCLCGPSGCGKTTLLNLVAGLEFPSSGEVRVRGERSPGPGPTGR